MSNEEIQRKILEFLYKKWKEEPFQFPSIRKLIASGTIKASWETLHANAGYLASKGLIEQPETMKCYTKITAFGIDQIENKKISSDVKIRKRILKVLKDFSDKEPLTYLQKGRMIELSGLSDVEVCRNIMYLEQKGYVDVRWATGGHFGAKISALGLDYLKEPTLLEAETNFMSNAYSILYKLENELRIFIERKLREKYGEQWWEKGVPIKIRKNSEKQMEASSKFSLICYTEFADLRKIIMKNWSGVFKQHFKTLEQVVSRLDELEPIRHTIAHTRLLSNEDFEKLNLFYREIKKMIE